MRPRPTATSKAKTRSLRLPARKNGALKSAVVPLRERRLSFGAKWDYAPAPETVPGNIAPRYELFIDGKFRAPRAGKYFDSINPATEEKLSEIAAADAEDVALAVSAARRAYEKVWSKMPGRERGKFLYRIARLIQERRILICPPSRRDRKNGRPPVEDQCRGFP